MRGDELLRIAGTGTAGTGRLDWHAIMRWASQEGLPRETYDNGGVRCLDSI